MAAKYIFFICLSSIIAFGSAQNISCYDCDPRNSNETCGDPAGSNAKVTPCAVVENATTICYSSFMSFSGDRVNDTGIYRGCKILFPGVRDFCDWFQEERQGINLTIPSCVPCTTTKCNTVRFNADGTSGAKAIFSLGVLGISCIFIILVGLLG